MPQTSSSHRSRRRGRGRHERRRKTSLLGSIFKWLAISGLSLGIIAAIGVGYLYYKIAPELPDVKLLREVELQMPLRVFTADGDLIAEYGEQRREPVQISEVPQVLQDAIVAAEDARFYKHPGVDYQGILRAVLHLIKTGEKGPGGSTITMQVARNFFLTRDVTYARKIKEIFLSFKIENELEKDEILELYVNKIYLGNRSYGFAAASKVYYGKKITEINLPEAAMLAGLPKAPSRYNPIVNPQRAKQRRSYVLRRLMEIGKIDERTYRATLDAPVTATLHYSRPEAEADYVGEMARARVQQLFGDRWSTAGFNVFTTIRSNDQQIANRSLRDALFDYERRHGFKGAIDQLDANILQNPEQLAEALRKYSNHGEMIASAVTAVSDESAVVITEDLIEYTFALEEDIDWARERLDIDQLGKELTSVTEVFEVGDVIYLQATDENSARIVQEPSVEAAFVAMEPNSGAIKALVGGFDFHRSKFNRVTQARRQPGSTFKPFIYSAALEYGDTPATIYNDAPVVFHDPALEGEWRPRNYSGRFYGPTRLREALVYSMNLVSVRVLREITVPYAIDYAERFGFDESNMPPDLSLALGSAAVTPMEMTSAFSVFANGGYRVQPHFIDRIEDPRGNVVYDTPKVVLCDDCDPAAASPLLAEMEAETAAQSPKTAVDDESTANAEEISELDIINAPRVIDERNAFIMSSMMRDVVRRGTARRAGEALSRQDLGGKTGTTNNQLDAWFVGFGSDVVAAAWIGSDGLDPLGRRESGGIAALPIWTSYIQHTLDGVPEAEIVEPEGLKKVRVDRSTGEASAGDGTVLELFFEDNHPEADAATESISNGSSNGAATTAAPKTVKETVKEVESLF